MSNTLMQTKISRRDFLKFTAAAGVTAAGGYMLAEYTPWLDTAAAAARATQPLAAGPAVLPPMRELVRQATLAANGHNAQAWQFAVEESAIEIRPDLSRRLPVVDPHDRELWISLGCALENLLVAARAGGWATVVTYPEAAETIRIDLARDTPQADPLFDAIPLRQTTRSAFDGRAVGTADLDPLMALPLEPGVSLRWLTDTAGMEAALEYVSEGNRRQYADEAFLDELVDWLRFNKKEALRTQDGLYTRASGNPEVPRWLGGMFVRGTKPQQQADADAEKWRSSAGGVVVASAAEDRASWVRTGQVYERLALAMTARGIKNAFMNQPIEVAGLRDQFRAALGLGDNHPQLLLRYGYAEAMPRSLRRPVDGVIVNV